MTIQLRPLDLEAFDATGACLTSARRFVGGWVAQMHYHGFKAGIYGSAGGSHLDDFYTIDNPPDDIFAARESSPINLNVFALDAYIPDTHWDGTHRLRQYNLDTSATYGGVAMTIDRDCAYGRLVPASWSGSPYADCYS